MLKSIAFLMEVKMNKIVDLHIHTRYSDGYYMPKELISLVKEKGLDIIAITDHDSVEGLQTITQSDKIKVIKGIEMTTRDEETIHILGYNIDINNKVLTEHLNKFRTSKFYTVIACLNVLKERYNISFSADDITELFNQPGSIGRVDLARLCVKYNYVNKVSEAFDKYLADIYNYIDVSEIQLNCEQAIDIIHQAGGIAVLAHPGVYKKTNTEALIKKLAQAGLDGIEAYHSLHDEDTSAYYLALAKKYNLLVSGGSDYHGDKIKDSIPINYACLHEMTQDKLTVLDKLIGVTYE